MIIHITAKSSSTSCRQHKWQCFVLVMALLEMVVRGKEMESVTFSYPKATNCFLPLIGDTKWRTATVGTICTEVGIWRKSTRVPSPVVLNSVTRSPALESTGSGSEVNWLIDGLCCQGVPAIDLAHVDLTGGEQRPEQHRRRICRWQHGLRFDPPLELFV